MVLHRPVELARLIGMWPTSDQFAQLAKLSQIGVRYIHLLATFANCGLLQKRPLSVLDNRVAKSLDPNAILEFQEDWEC